MGISQSRFPETCGRNFRIEAIQSGEELPHWYVASEFNFSLERSHLD
jgi:hypothetical protein